MTAFRGRPPLASDVWMLEQQVRAELEAEAWRRLREHMAEPLSAPRADRPRAGSAVLKGLVRFILAAFGAYLGWLAAVDARLGELEIWFSAGAGFAIMLALSMFGYARDFVHLLAETVRWAIVCGVAVGALWLLFQMA